ncbi:MAG: hypothetical protein ABXS92_08680 [Sulfurimonas sp.]
MKKIGILIIAALSGIFLFQMCGRETQENHANTTESPEKTFDTPMKTNEKRIEAQNIANTIQSPNRYLNSRVNARESAKKAVNESSRRMKEQDKAIGNFMK